MRGRSAEFSKTSCHCRALQGADSEREGDDVIASEAVATAAGVCKGVVEAARMEGG